jgi:hypothetical protein
VRRLALAALALTGCSFAPGSAYVGEWRARAVVDHEICVEDAAGRCATRRPVVRSVPARSFWGAELTVANLGVGVIRRDGDDQVAFSAAGGLELLLGRGRLGYGVRAGAAADLFAGGELVTAEVDAIGRLGLSDRFAAYLAVGAVPYGRLSRDGAAPEVGHLGGQVRAGLQIVLTQVIDARAVLDLELGSARLALPSGGLGRDRLLAHLGLFF